MMQMGFRRKECGSCGSKDLFTFLDLGKTPLANRDPATPNESEYRFPLQLAICGACELVQMMEVISDHELYGVDYGFYSGGSPAQLDYHRRGAELLLSRHKDQAQRLTVEVACNDGSLLQHFRHANCPTLGVDPAAGPVSVARDRGLNVINQPLGRELAREIREEHGAAGLVIAYNSMAHVEDLGDVLSGVRTLMDKDSVAVFEVQYLPDLLAGNMYDQVYHEHRFFYSLSSLRSAAANHGLRVVDAELIELQNGGIRVALSTDMTRAVSPAVERIARTEKWVWDGCRAFQGKVDRTRDHLRSLVDAELARGTLGGYGAAAKATTILNFCGIGRRELAYVVDTTPYKHGRFVPGTGVEIVSPEHYKAHPVDSLLLLAANYLGTVLRQNPHKGRWIVPQPLPQVI